MSENNSKTTTDSSTGDPPTNTSPELTGTAGGPQFYTKYSTTTGIDWDTDGSQQTVPPNVLPVVQPFTSPYTMPLLSSVPPASPPPITIDPKDLIISHMKSKHPSKVTKLQRRARAFARLLKEESFKAMKDNPKASRGEIFAILKDVFHDKYHGIYDDLLMTIMAEEMARRLGAKDEDEEVTPTPIFSGLFNTSSNIWSRIRSII